MIFKQKQIIHSGAQSMHPNFSVQTRPGGVAGGLAAGRTGGLWAAGGGQGDIPRPGVRLTWLLLKSGTAPGEKLLWWVKVSDDPKSSQCSEA